MCDQNSGSPESDDRNKLCEKDDGFRPAGVVLRQIEDLGGESIWSSTRGSGIPPQKIYLWQHRGKTDSGSRHGRGAMRGRTEKEALELEQDQGTDSGLLEEGVGVASEGDVDVDVDVDTDIVSRLPVTKSLPVERKLRVLDTLPPPSL